MVPNFALTCVQAVSAEHTTSGRRGTASPPPGGCGKIPSRRRHHPRLPIRFLVQDPMTAHLDTREAAEKDADIKGLNIRGIKDKQTAGRVSKVEFLSTRPYGSNCRRASGTVQFTTSSGILATAP